MNLSPGDSFVQIAGPLFARPSVKEGLASTFRYFTSVELTTNGVKHRADVYTDYAEKLSRGFDLCVISDHETAPLYVYGALHSGKSADSTAFYSIGKLTLDLLVDQCWWSFITSEKP